MEMETAYSPAVNDIYRIGNGELLSRLVTKLKEGGSISKDIGLEDVLDGSLEDSEKRILEDEAVKLLEKRAALGWKSFDCYHTSSREYKIGSRVPLDSEGKAHFSDIDTLYSKNGTVKFVYKVGAEGRVLDENAPKGLEGWYYSRTPLVVEQAWKVEDFMKKYPQARFV